VLSLVLLVIALAGGNTVAAQNHSFPREHQIKAAFLYNFARFIDWPASAFADDSTKMVVGILGEDPFGEDLDQTIQGKKVGGRGLAIKRFRRLEELEPIQILFISSSEKKHLTHILEALQGMSVLTVSEVDGFAQRGVVINFFLENRKIRFEINVDAAKRAGLRISSKLLRLARVVQEDNSGEAK
jgi:hypothetical protein